MKGDDDNARDQDMAKLVSKAGSQVTRRRFTDIPGLIREVYASLVESLENRAVALPNQKTLYLAGFDDSRNKRINLGGIPTGPKSPSSQ